VSVVTPVIPASQEAEIWRTVVRSQPEQNSSRDPISKNLSRKRARGVAQGVGPELKPQYGNKKKENSKESQLKPFYKILDIFCLRQGLAM
jgi:hypothetical protein